MPPPPLPNPELDRFLRAIRRSGLLPPGRVDALVAEAPQASARNPDKLGEFLVEQGTLTLFQVAKLKQGTWQGLALGPFHILSPLGRGGMGTVYLAHDTRKPKGREGLVALKVLPPKRAREEDRMLARFVREMDLAQRVSHSHLTKTYATGEVGGVHYIAMEYIRGMSLRRLVAEQGPLGVPRAARLFAEVADGLQSAHEQGLIHRDLKPSNIMVTPNGHAKILDMGLALAVGEELPQDKTIAGGRGYVVGTMDYIAPEQIDNPIGIDSRADLYALGCSIYFALAGLPPFPGGTSIDKMKRHRKEYAAPLSDFNPTIAADFSRIVERLMEKTPANRFHSAAAVRDALLPWAVGDPERPMDVDPDQSEAEIVQELERTQKDPGEFFESVPVVVFADKGKKAARRRGRAEASQEPVENGQAKSLPIWLWLVPAAIAMMVLAGSVMALLLYLFRA